VLNRIQKVKNALLGELSSEPTQKIVCVTLLIVNKIASVAVRITLVVHVSRILAPRFV